MLVPARDLDDDLYGSYRLVSRSGARRRPRRQGRAVRRRTVRRRHRRAPVAHADRLSIYAPRGTGAALEPLGPDRWILSQIDQGAVGAFPVALIPVLMPLVQQLIAKSLEESGGDPAQALQRMVQLTQRRAPNVSGYGCASGPCRCEGAAW